MTWPEAFLCAVVLAAFALVLMKASIGRVAAFVVFVGVFLTLVDALPGVRS